MPRPRSTENAKLARQRRHLKSTYGLTLEEFDQMWADQDGFCAICGLRPMGIGRHQKELMVDHDHATGLVRGLLCDRCNVGLGMFRDNPEFLRSAASYLERD